MEASGVAYLSVSFKTPDSGYPTRFVIVSLVHEQSRFVGQHHQRVRSQAHSHFIPGEERVSCHLGRIGVRGIAERLIKGDLQQPMGLDMVDHLAFKRAPYQPAQGLAEEPDPWGGLFEGERGKRGVRLMQEPFACIVGQLEHVP
jgi:hypothetical protein